MELLVSNKSIGDYAKDLYDTLIKTDEKSNVDSILSRISDITIEDKSNTKLTQLSVLGVKTHPEMVVDILKKSDPDLALDLAVIGALELTNQVIKGIIPENKMLELKGDD